MNQSSENGLLEGPQKKISLLLALSPIICLVILLGGGYYLFGSDAAAGPNQIALLFCSLVAIAVGVQAGFDWDELWEAGIASVSTGLGAIFILFAVGSLIGTWALSGTLIAMVYWGLQILSPDYFYVTTMLICCIVSVSIGSSWTTAGTIGIGLMGISHQMGLDPAITAGAVLSGSYFGDKSSPLSDATNLAAVAAGSDIYTHVKEALWTSVPTLFIAIFLFWMLGHAGDFDSNETTQMIAAHFDVSILPFLPLALVLVMAFTRWSPFIAIFCGALAGGVLAIITAPDRVISFADPQGELPSILALIKGMWSTMGTGYISETGNADIDKLLSRGGMESMLNTIWLIVTALCFGGVVERAGILDRIMEPIIKAAQTTGSLVASLVTAGISTNMLAADQYIAIVLPGRMFQRVFKQRGLQPVVVSRAIGDSSTVTSCLVPWNSGGAYMAATLGVATLDYLPYAFFNLFNPLITIAAAFAGYRMLKAPSPEIEKEQAREKLEA